MFKINNIAKANGNYAEESQPNPLRWLILYKNDDGTFEPQGYWLKCKDFFNDYAFTYMTGHKFRIYGFEAGNMQIRKGEPVYMALKALTDSFSHNMLMMNEWLHANGIPQVECHQQKDYTIIQLDPFYFKNTYNISLISLIIRLMNDEKKFESFEQVINYKGFPAKDQQKWDQVVKKGWFFNIPEKLKDYIWVYSSTSNDKKVAGDSYQISGLVHNCGVLSWQGAA